ncbi:sugar MFS transporter [Horticoccus luteus]|uniref:Sugar MFS transporter n=1 Tax=Horticoccus luteus TaxID=2862869 RepID=A0A8F9TV27_9BACT|nr:sugar MFS transporter [Horticoccus luteus]QYM78612.1 sugar MFS transporter [Horticoccus luteus]
MPSFPPPPPRATSLFRTVDGRNFLIPFLLVSSLFLIWGFCNGMIDVMDKHFQDQLHLSKAQSAWVQFSHYLGYFLMALPAGLLARKFGYKRAIITGLLVVATGGMWFVPATHINAFWAFLLGVCLISMGLTILETVANPYTTVLGPDQYAATRINLAQSCNGVGWILGPIVGGAFFYSSGGAAVAQGRLYIPYVAVSGIVLVMAGIFAFSSLPDLVASATSDNHPSAVDSDRLSIWRRPHFVGAVGAQFVYVAAQAGIFSFFINYMVEEAPPVSSAWVGSWFLHGGAAVRDGLHYINEQGASRLLGGIGFVLFLLGRFLGAGVLRRQPAHRVLGVCAVGNVVCCALVVARAGWISVAAVFLTFLFMSIMFPTIFALGIHGLGTQAKKASAFIVMAVMGGAVMPKLMGHLADIYNMSVSFLMPGACFAVIATYGFLWARLKRTGELTSAAVQRGV